MCGEDNPVMDDILNVIVQGSTFGLVGVDQNAEFAPGLIGKPAVELTKEVTGAKAAEEANQMMREQIEAEKEAALNDRKIAQNQNAANQMAASRKASVARSSSARSNTNAPSSYSKLGEGERDFLGL